MRSVFIPAEGISAVNERRLLIFEVAKGEAALPQFQFDDCFDCFDHLLFFCNTATPHLVFMASTLQPCLAHLVMRKILVLDLDLGLKQKVCRPKRNRTRAQIKAVAHTPALYI